MVGKVPRTDASSPLLMVLSGFLSLHVPCSYILVHREGAFPWNGFLGVERGVDYKGCWTRPESLLEGLC